MSLSRYEQETIISFNREEDLAELYTADTIWMNKMDKLVEKNSKDFGLIDVQYHNGKIVSKTYSMPKRYTSIRTKDRHNHYTEEQLAQIAGRLDNANKSGEAMS